MMEDNSEKWAFKAGQVFYLEDRYVGINNDTDLNTPRLTTQSAAIC